MFRSPLAIPFTEVDKVMAGVEVAVAISTPPGRASPPLKRW